MLQFYLKGIHRLTKHSHVKKKIANKEIVLDMKDVYRTLNSKEFRHHIIEYNETYDPVNKRITQRVLIRLNKPRLVNMQKGKVLCNTFVVIDFTTKEVRTCYLNDVRDTHDTINMDRYKADLKVRDLKRGGYPVSTWQDKRKVNSRGRK